jgi:vacuolar-type H+-ATPase subunit E/Vma4
MTAAVSRRSSRGETKTLAVLLEPVRAALLTDASEEADRVLAAADREAAEITASADAEMAAARQRAEGRGRRSAEARADQLLAQARSDAHRHVLETKEAIRRRLVAAVHEAALGLRNDERYPMLLDRLEAMARRQLGADATIERDPPDVGGVRAGTADRRVDYSLIALSDRALQTMADEMARLWS